MFSNKQVEDIVKNNRLDLAEEFFERLGEAIDEEEAIRAEYEKASTDRLKQLADNGDDYAAVYYVRKRIEEDVLVASDMKYLERSLLNLNEDAAMVGSWLYAMKNGRYTDKEKEIFSLAVLEQEAFKDAHKRLIKEYKKNGDVIAETDSAILTVSINRWAAEALRDKGFYAFTADVVPLEKDCSYPDIKSGYRVNMRLLHENGRETEDETVYIAYERGKGKDARKRELGDDLTEILSRIAEKVNLRAGDAYIDGKRYFHYGAKTEGKKKTSEDGVKILSAADVNIKVSDEGRLKGNVCPYCGGSLDFGGTCTACGKSAEQNDSGNITIRQGKNVEALVCTQCGSPVKLDENGKTAYCSACGTTFAVSGSDLKSGVTGLDYESIKADMPEGAELPKVQFVRAKIADGAITAVMPKNFMVMSEDIRRIKYPANAPKYIYTTPDATVNFNVNFLGPLEEKDVFAFGKQMLAALKNVHSTAKFGEAVKLTEPRNVFFVDFITAGLDQDIYNAMFFFSHFGRQGIGSWNCLSKDRWFWAPVFEHAVKTMQFNKI